jgi:zinc transporter ZupT
MSNLAGVLSRQPPRVQMAARVALPLVSLLTVLLLVAGVGVGVTGAAPLPVERIHVDRVVFPSPGTIELNVINDGPLPVRVAQVMVDDAFWQFRQEPPGDIPVLGRATFTVPYPWVTADAHVVTLLSSTGATTVAEVPLVAPTPALDTALLARLGVLGILIGVVPVALGMLWVPAMRRASPWVLDALLGVTVGLMAFLLVETVAEGVAAAAAVAEALDGLAILVGAILGTYLVLELLASRQGSRSGALFSLPVLLAAAIGLHNLAEGLAVGSAIAGGALEFGAFLVIGFTLQNVSEGIGIGASVVDRTPRLATWVLLVALAGLPAVAGAWIGGAAPSPLTTVLFLGIGGGAIAQVLVALMRMLRNRLQGIGRTWTAAAGGAALGFLVMYLTGLALPPA